MSIEEKLLKADKRRRLIYVDASGNSEEFKISMYDPEKNATHILQLKDVKNSHEAEQYAICYAVLYVKKHAYKKCHILCDNQSAANSKVTKKLSQIYSIGISWIPREANMVADKISKLEPTLKDKDWNILKLFVDLIVNFTKANESNVDSDTTDLRQDIIKLKQTLEVKNTKISNQAKQINALRGKVK